MRRLGLLAVSGCAAAFGQPTLTAVHDTIYDLYGNLYTGPVTIQLSAQGVTQGTNQALSVVKSVFVRNGALSVSLIPTDTATPTGAAYIFTFGNGAVKTCVIPTSAAPIALAGYCIDSAINGGMVTSIPLSWLAQSGASEGQAVCWNGTSYAPGDCGGAGGDGSDGVSVTVTAENAGAHCTYAGFKLVSVSGTSYVCNGAPGAAGAQGAQGVQGNAGSNGSNGAQGVQGPAGPAPAGTGLVKSTNGVAGLATAGTDYVAPGTVDILRFGICIAAGCGSETTINYIATMGAGSFTECAFNLATAATGSSVIVDVQDGSGTSIFGATKLVATAANGTAVEYQSTFANSPQTYARGSKYKAVILQNDSGGAAQGGTVQCR